MIVKCEVLFLMEYARPIARGCIRLAIGPTSTKISETLKSDGDPIFFSTALLTADLRVFSTTRTAPRVVTFNKANASPTDFPRIASATYLTFRGAIRIYLYFAMAVATFNSLTLTYFLVDFSTFEPPWDLKSLVGENSPSLWPTMFSVTYTGTNFLPL